MSGDGTDDGDAPPLRSVAEERRDPKTGRLLPGHPYRWTPGESGNKNGRPRGIKAIFQQAFEELAKEDERFSQGAVLLAKALIIEAMRKDSKHKVQALEKALDRSIGKVPQPFRISQPDEDDERASFTDLRVRVVTREDIERERRQLVSGNGDDPDSDDADVPE